MAIPRELLFDVWREACRHIRITESAAAIAQRLADGLLLAQLVVRRIDAPRSCLETVAVAFDAGNGPWDGGRITLASDQVERLLTWCNQRRVVRRRANDPPPGLADKFRLLVPRGLTSDVMAGPLFDSRGPSGVLLMVAVPSQEFTAAHESLLDALLEPFSVALDKDGRVREMATLREAAKAIRRSLLSRLGRQSLGDTLVGADMGLRSVMERAAILGDGVRLEVAKALGVQAARESDVPPPHASRGMNRRPSTRILPPDEVVKAHVNRPWPRPTAASKVPMVQPSASRSTLTPCGPVRKLGN